MPMTNDELVADLEAERDEIRAKLRLISGDTSFSEAGAKPDASGKDATAHQAYYKSLREREKEIIQSLRELSDDQPFWREGRGVA